MINEFESLIPEATEIVGEKISGEVEEEKAKKSEEIDEMMAKRMEKGNLSENIVPKTGVPLSTPTSVTEGPVIGPQKTIQLGKVIEDKITEDRGVNSLENE